MADIEYLTNAFFYFEIDGITDLLLKNVTGPEIEMIVAGGEAPVGVTKGGKTQAWANIGGVQYNTEVTLTYVAGNESQQKKLNDWYNECASESFAGGPNKARSNRKTGTLTIYDGNNNECMKFSFTDLLPSGKSQLGAIAPDNAGNLGEYTMKMQFTQVTRTL